MLVCFFFTFLPSGTVADHAWLSQHPAALIDSNTHSHLGAAAFKLRPLKSDTGSSAEIVRVAAPCFRASQQQFNKEPYHFTFFFFYWWCHPSIQTWICKYLLQSEGLLMVSFVNNAAFCETVTRNSSHRWSYHFASFLLLSICFCFAFIVLRINRLLDVS